MKVGPFGNCKQAQLQKTLQIQNCGGLIVVDKRSQNIVAVSANIHEFIGKNSGELMGQPWSTLLTPTMVGSMFLPPERDATVAQVTQAAINDVQLEISNHCVEHYCMVELCPGGEKNIAQSFSLKTEFIIQLSQTKNELESAKLAMQEIARQTGFDRVMLYQFLPEWHGQVVAEQNKPRVEGFLGLRFPEGDVPANVRRLSTLNLQRLIADVEADGVPIELGNDEIELDLTWTQLRAVHPVHIQYLKNMGVHATFSLSIVCGGKLWGMIACHQLSPKTLTTSQRQYCEELVRITALHMNSVISSNLERKRYGYRVALSEIRGAINAEAKGFGAINTHIEELKTLFSADGIWHHFNGVDYFSGNVPDKTSLSLLKNWIDSLDHRTVSSTDSIPNDLASYPALVRFCSGLLYIPLNSRDFILLMRHEQVETVEWAGKPHSLDAQDESVLALTPRASFQQWSQNVKGKSKPWHTLDIESAQMLRTELIEYIEFSEIETMALKDPLTGIANRLLFERQLKVSLKKAIEDGQMFAVYMIDLDNFKPVNDTMGHAAGDEVLIQVSQRISALLREEDTVARLGGDEFAVILGHVSDQTAVDEIAARLLDEIKKPIDISGQKVAICASIGVSVCPLDASTQAELMADADIALYEVKKAGRNGFRRFDRSLLTDQQALENSRILIEAAFEKGQFELTYQPLIDIKGKTLHGFESFCIWNHPTDGRLLARDYYDLIERNQLATLWAEWGLKTLFLQYQQWHRAGLQVVPLCLNIAAKQFLNLDIVGLCRSLAEEHQVNTSWLRLDLDEQTLVMSSRNAEEKITALKELGILVNIDHFGQGLVSLRQLSKLKINALKIPGRLLSAGAGNRDLDAQVAIFQSISNVMNVPVIATQIEDRATFTRAKELGINHLQGFVVANPMSAEDASVWLRDSKAKIAKLNL